MTGLERSNRGRHEEFSIVGLVAAIIGLMLVLSLMPACLSLDLLKGGIEKTPAVYSIKENSPSLVGTSITSSSTRFPFQRKSFYANGRFWAFYSDGTNLAYRVSIDGANWSAATTVRASTAGDQFSVWYDGTYVHYAYASGLAGDHLLYRRGTLNADGTITWSDAEHIAVPGEVTTLYRRSINAFDNVWVMNATSGADNLDTEVIVKTIPANRIFMINPFQSTVATTLYRRSINAFDNVWVMNATSGADNLDTEVITETTSANRIFMINPFQSTVTNIGTTLPATITSKGWRSESPINHMGGDYRIDYELVNRAAASHAGRLYMRLWRSSDPNMVGAENITGWSYASISFTATAGEVKTGSLTFSNVPGFENRYLYVEFCWMITTASTSSEAGFRMRANSAANTTIYSELRYYNPFVCVDSSGRPWIGYRRTNIATYHPFVTKSNLDNGTWQTANGFPYQLSTTSTTGWYVTILPLTNNKVYAIYVRTGAGNTKGMLWDISWGIEETVTALNLEAGTRYSATNEGDDIHFAFIEAAEYHIRYVRRIWGAGWSAAETVQSFTTSTSAPVLSFDTITETLYCFWAGSPTANHIYYKRRINGVWDTDPIDWIDETTEVLTGNDRLTSFYKVYGANMGLLYMTKTESPYDVKFDYISLAPHLYLPENCDAINDNTPTFRWDNFWVADNYELWVDNDPDFSSPEVFDNTLDNYYDLNIELPEGLTDENYHWRVRAYKGSITLFSESWTLLIDTVPPEAPTLLTPADGTTTDDNAPTIQCSTVNDTSKSATGEAAGVGYYEFWVDNDSDFLSPEICENSTNNVYTPAELKGENYSWKARAWDRAGNVSSFSSVWTFVIENFSISADPESLEIMRGAQGAVNLSVIEDYGPSENATLSGSWISGTPDDVTYSFTPAENKMPFESTLTFNIGPSATPGTFTYRVKATSDSGMDRTSDIKVTIVSTIFTVDSYPKALELMRSDTATSTVSVNYLLGKKETVFLTGSWIGAAPIDVTTSFSLESGIPPFRSTLRFTTGKNAASGSFTYRVTGQGGGLTRTDDITVNIATDLTLTLNTDKTSYEKGQKIRISGTAKDPKGNQVDNGEATITLRSGNWTKQLNTKITNGSYTENYFITFDNPEGNWTISVSAMDNRGNLGQASENVSISVTIPAAWRYYTITFLSPVPGTVCSRGSEVTVTIQITEGSEKVNEAEVYLATPSGEIITLTEGSPGIYSTTYVFRWDDPVGEWTVSVLGEKTVQDVYKAGTGSTSLNIAPANLEIELLEPSKRMFEVGEKVDVKVRVSYPDGSPVDGAIVIITLPNGENLTLLNEGEGIYRGSYSVSSKDLGACVLMVSAVDAYGNSGDSCEVTLSVGEPSPTSYPIRYWWITIPVVLACAIVPIPTVVKKLRIRKLKSIKNEIRATEKLRRDLPKRYFVEGAIPRETYDLLVHQSLEKLMKLKKDARKLEKRLEKRDLT